MLRNIAFWFSFMAAAFLFSMYSLDITLLIQRSDQLRNPFESTARTIQYSWSILPLILAIIAYPLLVRRTSLVIANRSFVSPKYGVLATVFLGVFVLLALTIYGPRFIPELKQLAFSAGLFKLWLPIPILLAYITSEIGSLNKVSSNSTPANAADRDSFAPRGEVRQILLIAGFVTVIATVAARAVSDHPITDFGSTIYSLFTTAILSAAGAYVCFSLGQRSPRFQCSLPSIVLGAIFLIPAFVPFSRLLSKIHLPLIQAVVYSKQTVLLPLINFLIMLASLVLTILLASTIYGIWALGINSLTNHSRGTR